MWISVTVVVVAVAGGGLFAWRNWHNRYVWPRQPVPSHQDLPPADRSQWPQPPIPWQTPVTAVTVATPAGQQPTNITYHVNALGMKFVRIEPGSFWMGLTAEQAARTSAEKKIGGPVTLTKPYYLAAHETTVALFEQFDPGFKTRRQKYQRGDGFESHPVDGVTWQEAQRFCR
ncbi:hypothetical protein HQ590_12945, partial [bacterium]|nr:hypothetical protein [bacterium]